MNHNCKLEMGPCSCGAWHTEEEIRLFALSLLEEIFDLKRSVAGLTEQYTEALRTLAMYGMDPL